MLRRFTTLHTVRSVRSSIRQVTRRGKTRTGIATFTRCIYADARLLTYRLQNMENYEQREKKILSST
uniref:Ferredoxin-2, putative n=1 Tax=Arundo donax TaxID=35708 RepID=A0A0A9DBW6_ARUDO